jgi:hypothetical protein
MNITFSTQPNFSWAWSGLAINVTWFTIPSYFSAKAIGESYHKNRITTLSSSKYFYKYFPRLLSSG